MTRAMNKRAKIHLLPTEPSSAETCIGVRDNIMAYHLAIHHLALSKFYHIYITTDDEIKEDDWYYVSGGIGASIGIYKAEKSPVNNDWRHKIIATTDPELIVYVGQDYTGTVIRKNGKNHQRLPQPSKAFIEKYCEVGGIDEVDVEYGLFHDGNFKDDDETHAFKATRKPRVNLHNEIIIHLIEQKMYSRDEVYKIAKVAYRMGAQNHNDATVERFDEWIKENL